MGYYRLFRMRVFAHLGFLSLHVLSAFNCTVPMAVSRCASVQRGKAMLPPHVLCKIRYSFHFGSLRMAIPVLLPSFAQMHLSSPACVCHIVQIRWKSPLGLNTTRSLCISALFRATFAMLQTQKGTEELSPKHIGEILMLFTRLCWGPFRLCPGLFVPFLWEIQMHRENVYWGSSCISRMSLPPLPSL